MRKQRQGKVISDRMQSTVVVEVMSLFSHPMYKKIIKRRTKLVVHNPDNKAKLGDIVKIIETKPLSKTKRWKILEILKEAAGGLEPVAKRETVKSDKSSKGAK